MDTSKNNQRKYLGVYTSATSSDTINYASIYYRHAYEGLFLELLKLNCTPVLLFDQDKNYLGKGKFKEYWECFDNNGKIDFVYRNKPITVKYIFDKNRFKHDDVAVSDPAEVREICRDKYQSYLFVPDLHAPSFLLQNRHQLEVFAKSHVDQNIALKELDGNGGKAVFVGKIQDYDHSLTYPLLAQEFIDTSIGIPGLCEGPHDLRIVMYDGQIISLFLRKPPKDSHKSNLAYGGGYAELDIAKAPKELGAIAKNIDARFATNKTRFFSIDFGNTPKGWKAFELNAWPGLGYESENEILFTKRLAKCLINSLDHELKTSKEM